MMEKDGRRVLVVAPNYQWFRLYCRLNHVPDEGRMAPKFVHDEWGLRGFHPPEVHLVFLAGWHSRWNYGYQEAMRFNAYANSFIRMGATREVYYT